MAMVGRSKSFQFMRQALACSPSSLAPSRHNVLSGPNHLITSRVLNTASFQGPHIMGIVPSIRFYDDFGRLSVNQFRGVSTSVSNLPEIADPDVLEALKRLLAVNWIEISEEAEDAVEAALTKKTSDTAGVEKLKNAWCAAEAVEKFSGTLVTIRMALDDLTGLTGEKVRPLPPLLLDALKSALSRYGNYLAAFSEDEVYLKKKVEVELGSLLVHIGQRCSGLGAEWGDISLLGTTGLAGSFIELRAH